MLPLASDTTVSTSHVQPVFGCSTSKHHVLWQNITFAFENGILLVSHHGVNNVMIVD